MRVHPFVDVNDRFLSGQITAVNIDRNIAKNLFALFQRIVNIN